MRQHDCALSVFTAPDHWDLMDHLTTTTQPRINDYVRPLLARKWLILAVVIVATGAVYALYALQANVYTTSTLVYVKDPGDPVSGQVNQQATDRQVEDQASLLDSRSTAALVARDIGFKGTTTDLLDRVSITSRPGQDFVQFSAEGRSPEEAAAIANGFGQEFVALVEGAYAARVARAIRTSKEQLAALGTGHTADLGRSDLVTQIDRLRLIQQDPQMIAQMVQTALPPSAPTSPKPLRNALFALAISLVLAIGVAFGLERFDRRLKDPEQAEQAYGTPLLAVLPHANEPSMVRRDVALLSPDFKEPFRLLRINIELAALDAFPRTIVVTSAMPNEGKTTVVRNLALSLAESGRRVAVLGLDLRHPSLGEMFGVTPGAGMTDVLRHSATLDDVMVEVPVQPPGIEAILHGAPLGVSPKGVSGGEGVGANGFNANGAGHTIGNGNGRRPAGSGLTGVGGAGVTLIQAGPRPANPPAVLASDRLAEVLDAVAARFDVVLIDSAPLLAVTDTVPLIRHADATLVVGRLGVTTRDTAKRVMDFIARIPRTTLLGVVANDLSRLDAESYGYGYGYGYGAYREDEPTTVDDERPVAANA